MDIKETPDHIGNDVFDLLQIDEKLIHSADSYIVCIYFGNYTFDWEIWVFV